MGTILSKDEFRAEVRQHLENGAPSIAEAVVRVFKERAIGQELRNSYAISGAIQDCGQFEMQWRNELTERIRRGLPPRPTTGGAGVGTGTTGLIGGSVEPPITTERKRVSTLENFCISTNPGREYKCVLDYTREDYDFAIRNLEARYNTFYDHAQVLRSARSFTTAAKAKTARELDDDRLMAFEKLFEDWK